MTTPNRRTTEKWTATHTRNCITIQKDVGHMSHVWFAANLSSLPDEMSRVVGQAIVDAVNEYNTRPRRILSARYYTTYKDTNAISIRDNETQDVVCMLHGNLNEDLARLYELGEDVCKMLIEELGYDDYNCEWW